MPNHAQLLTDLESLKNMLSATACGGAQDDPEYGVLRKRLMASPLKDRLPRFVHTCRDLGEFWGFIQPKFAHYKERRVFLAEEFHPLLFELEQAETHPSDVGIEQVLAKIDATHVQEAWQKALERRLDDPEGAITAARTLLEAVCKHILDGCGVPYDETADLPRLHGLVIEQLNLAPSQHTEPLFKQILGSCQGIVNGLGAIRNKLGDAHGKAPRQVRPASRHAALAVNLAGAMAGFLIETWETRKPHTASH